MSNYSYPFPAEPEFARYVQTADGQYRSHPLPASALQYSASGAASGHPQPLPSPSSSLVSPSVASSLARGFSYSAALMASTSREDSSSLSSSGGFERMTNADQQQQQQQQHYFDQLRQQQHTTQQPHRQHIAPQQSQQAHPLRHLPSATVKRQYEPQHPQPQQGDELRLPHCLPHHGHHSRHPLLAAHTLDPHSPQSPPLSLLPLSSLGLDGGVKQESRSPIRDDLSAASGCSLSQSQAEQPLDPFLHHFPFSFIVHLRSGDRSFLPRSVLAPLSLSASQLLHLAANISSFLTLHSPSSPPLSQDVPLMSLPSVQQRASEQAAALRAGVLDSLPPFKPCSPVLLPRSTALAMQQPPPPFKVQRKEETADGEDEEDEQMDGTAGSTAACSFLLSPPVSDPQHLHVLFDLSEDVKPCTRLGCGNMLVKKSSRRSCDECQLYGHTLRTAQLLQFVIPSEFPQPAAALSASAPDCLRCFSTLSVPDQQLVCAQLQAAMDAALHKVEHWKFEMPEHRAFILVFASAESAQLVMKLLNRHLGLPPAPAASTAVPPVSSSPVPSPAHASDSTDSEPSVSSRSRSSGGLSAEEVVSDSEAECGRRRKNSHSQSSNSSSSVDLAGRSVASTTSNSSASASSASSPPYEMTSPVPQTKAAAELPAARLLPASELLAGLTPTPRICWSWLIRQLSVSGA